MDKSKPLYENILIGNFLYGLGLAMGAGGSEQRIPACISLLQQTPLDPLLGDALIEFPGTVRLFEFKRHGVEPVMEFEKADFLRVALEDEPALFELSKRIHWFVQGGDMPDLDEQVMHVYPYLDLATGKAGGKMSLGRMVEALVQEVLQGQAEPVAPALLSSYLAFVAKFHTGAATGGGLLVHIDQTGRLRYAPLNDIRELALQQSRYIEKHRQLAPSLEAGLAPGRERDRSRGLSR